MYIKGMPASAMLPMYTIHCIGAVHILGQPLEGGGGGMPKDDDC